MLSDTSRSPCKGLDLELALREIDAGRGTKFALAQITINQ